MVDFLFGWLTGNVWWAITARIALFFAIAYLFHRFAPRIAGRIMRLNRFAPPERRLRNERQSTLRFLISSAVSFAVFTLAFLASLNQFLDAENLIWMIGLFSAAFGLGARPLLADFLTGLSFIFEDSYDVGEKVEILGMEGVIESINLRTTRLRSPTGELYIIPNGEVRVIRNFSRGRFSVADIRISVASADLPRALALLQGLASEAVVVLPNLLEPWDVISETGELAQQTSLKLVVKARYGKAAEMRPRLLAYIQEQLAEAGIALAS